MRVVKHRRRLLVGVRLAVVLVICAQFRPGPAGAGAFAFVFGQQVEARGPGTLINLRGEPGLAGPVVTTVANGTTVTIIGGPAIADGANWWEVDGGASGTFGWAAEGLLQPARPAEAPAGRPAAALAECAVTGPDFPGLYHCQRANDVHVVVIDLNDPHVRFETVMANDAEGVDSAQQEWVSAMAERHPAAVAAINGDYFFPGRHGPEGLTVRNGERLDDLSTMERSALVIGQAPLDAPDARLPIPAAIVRLAEAGGPLEPAEAYNAVGGGPQLVFDAAWDWAPGFGFPSYRGCAADLPPDQVVNGECLANIDDWMVPGKPWSAAGLTADHKMIWVVGPYEHLAETLAAFNVETAMKLDGGGSSQLWYDRTMVPGFRPVANGLLVFYQRAAAVVTPPQWVVGVAGEPQPLRVILRNSGADTWTAGEVALAGPEGQAAVPLPHDVRPGETVTLAWTAAPYADCGLRRDTWRMADGGQAFPGRGVTITSIVLPQSMASERGRLAAQVGAWLEDEARPVRPGFFAELAREMRRTCAGGGGAAGGYR